MIGREENRQISSKAIVDSTKIVMRGLSSLGWHKLPKHHMCVHGSLRTRIYGNPRLWSVYEDEHANGLIKPIAQSAHSAVWSERVLLTFRSAYSGRPLFA